MIEKKIPLYPLKFKPIFKEKVWGGTRISKAFPDKKLQEKQIGELFCLSGLKSDVSVVANGPLEGKTINELLRIYKEELVGEKVYTKHKKQFPLLIKIIDAAEDLSIQVHPNDKIAQEKHNATGKNEMWYILEANTEAQLISGFKQPFSANKLKASINNGTLMEHLNQVKTQKGDTFYIPAGKIHSIGKGNLIAEIQQCSDLTYRVYDFDRKDFDGNKRELHLDSALEALNFNDDTNGQIDVNNEYLFSDDDFCVKKIIETDRIMRDYSNTNSFILLLNVGEMANLLIEKEEHNLNYMEHILIPSYIRECIIKSENNIEFLEVYMD